jgi:hypothetical protein
MKKLIITTGFLVLMFAALNLSTLAQDHQTHSAKAGGEELVVGQKGVVHTNKAVKAGEVTLPPSMYVLQHRVEGEDHVLVFKDVKMDYTISKPVKTMPSKDDPGTEVAKIKCKVEALSQKAGKTKIVLRTNAAGEKEIAEVYIKGEAFKHVL